MSGRSPNNDHLAELARLIGQDVPFRDRQDAARQDAARQDAPRQDAPRQEGVNRAPAQLAGRTAARRDAETPYVEAPQSAPGWLARQRGAAASAPPAAPPAQHYDDAHYEDDARYAAPAPQPRHRETSYDAQPRYAAVHHDDTAHGGADPYPQEYDAAYDPAYADDNGQYYEDGQHEPYAEEVPSRRPRRLMIAAAAVGLAVLGTGGVFAYRSVSGPSSSANPPVIRAQDTPNKVVPPPASADTQPVKQIYDRVSDKAGSERLGSTPEEPLDVKAQNQRTGIPGLLGAVPPTVAPQAGPAPAAEPRRVKTVPIRPDQTTGTTPPTSRAPAAAPPTTPLRITSNQAQTPPARNTAVSGGFVVQVASQRSEADAQASFRSLQAKYPGVLGSRAALIRKFDSGEKGTYYRAQVGPFTSIDQAKEMCSSLQAAGGQCVVQKN